MKKAIGIAVLLIVICVGTTFIVGDFLSAYNVQNIVNWTALFAILGIGAAFVIISGGIDLSIGSVVGLVGCTLSLLLNKWHVPPALAVPMVLALAAAIGLAHGLLVTKMRLQPFIVTLCGLLIYRGISRWITGDNTQGFAENFPGLRSLAVGTVSVPGIDEFQVPIPFFVMAALG